MKNIDISNSNLSIICQVYLPRGTEIKPVKDKNTGELFVDPSRVKEIERLNRNVLLARSNFYWLVKRQDLENAIAGADFIKNKDIFSVHGLNFYEMSLLAQYCGDISSGLMLAISPTRDLNYTISVHADKVLSDVPGKSDFCKAYLKMNLTLNGPNQDLVVAQMDLNNNADEQIFDSPNDIWPKYVVGINEGTRYIEIMPDSFTLHKCGIIQHGEFVDNRKYTQKTTRIMKLSSKKTSTRSTEE